MRPVFSYVNIGITLKIFLSKSTNVLGRLKKIQHLWSLSDHLPRLFTFLSVEKHDWPARNIIKVSNSSDPDQAQYSVGPNLGPNCLQML